MAGHSANPLDHVVDHPNLELPWFRGPHYEWKIELPSLGTFPGLGEVESLASC